MDTKSAALSSIRAESGSSAAPIALIASPRPEARMRLVCIPYGGGSASVFSRWPASLPEEIETVAIELPGHGRLVRAPLHRNIYPLIDQLTKLLSTLQDKPYVLFGHSLGALLAYSASLALERQNKPAAMHLVISGVRPPHLPSLLEEVCALSEEDFIHHLRDRKSIPEALLVNQAFMEVVSPIIRSDFELIVSYQQPKGEKLAMKATAFAGTDDNIAPPTDVEKWGDLVVDGIDMHYFEGHHFFIDQRQDLVLSALSTLCLDALNGC